MTYAVSQISNLPVHILQQLRLLKQPSDFLSAPYKDQVPTSLVFTSGTDTGEVDAWNRTVYEYKTQKLSIDNTVPYLEFNTADTQALLDMISIEVASTTLVLRTTTRELPADLTTDLYWVASITDIEAALTAFETALHTLKQDIAQLAAKLNDFSFDDMLTIPADADNHLIMIGPGGTILDSGYEVATNAEQKTTLRSVSQATVDALPKFVYGTWDLSCLPGTISLAQFKNGTLIIRGRATLYLYNISSKIELVDFTGSVYAYRCPDVTIGDRVALDTLTLVHSNLRLLGGRIRDFQLLRQSTVDHRRGIVQQVVHIGVACTYHSNMTPGLAKALVPPINAKSIQGTYIQANGDIAMNGKEVSFVTGHHDDPFPINTLYNIPNTDLNPDGGSGTEPYPEVNGLDIPSAYYDLSTEDYRTVIFSQQFMRTSAGPQTVEEISSEQFHALRACMNWCCGEFGPSIYGASYGKLIRTWCMYEQDSYYRGDNKTLEDFVLRLRTKILSWGGHDIWNTTFEELKNRTWMNDNYALDFMQDLYNNIRYPDLFGVTASSDLDVIKAMSGMPTMNETVALDNPNIPARNQPVVWSVTKRAVLNQFSGYEGWYVLYRPVAYDGYIRKGVNPGVTAEPGLPNT